MSRVRLRICVVGAGGAIGRRLVPLLVANGHEVIATTYSAQNVERVRGLGAETFPLDLFDRHATMGVVAAAKPEVIVHEATALSGASFSNMRRFDREFETTNRLRTVGTDNLLAAARAAGANRIVAQSYTSWPYAREGARIKNEEDALDPDPPQAMRQTIAAISYLEQAALAAKDIEGIVLRYGTLYGAGTSLTTGAGGIQVDAIRRRRLPIVGEGSGIWSFVHVADAAHATVLAIERGKPGIYNIVDDEPAPVAEWLPALAEAVGAKRPRRVPAWLGRLVGGEAALAIMTECRGASNAKAKRELGWNPLFDSWRRGFREGLGR